jgi:hypothetical protein
MDCLSIGDLASGTAERSLPVWRLNAKKQAAGQRKAFRLFSLKS